jgi:hypothetical protein
MARASRRGLTQPDTAKSATKAKTQSLDAAERDAAAGQDRDEQGATGSQTVRVMLRNATIERVAMADGRYLIYYSWPDDV